MEKCALYTSLMNAAERLHRNSHVPVPLAITEAIHLYKPELNKVLTTRKPKENSDIVQMVSPVTQATEMATFQEPYDRYQRVQTVKMEEQNPVINMYGVTNRSSDGNGHVRDQTTA